MIGHDEMSLHLHENYFDIDFAMKKIYTGQYDALVNALRVNHTSSYSFSKYLLFISWQLSVMQQ